MPISSIIIQPSSLALAAAYRPIVLKVNASGTDGNALPPVVYCDVYINNIFYKTQAKTQYEVKNEFDSTWTFDIQDAIQEYLTKPLPSNGQFVISEAAGLMASVFCRFRSSGYDSNTFITPEGGIPVQGTGSVPPLSGGGTQSNKFYVLNSTLQHHQNQDIATHLSFYKNGTWDANAWPLSHRKNGYRICVGDSDTYPFVYKGTGEFSKICLTYKLKGQSSFTTVCNDLALCAKVSNIVANTTNNGDGTQTIGFTFDTLSASVNSLQLYYRVQGSSDAWTIVTLDPTVTSASITLPFGLYEAKFLSNGVSCVGIFSDLQNFGIVITCTGVSLPGGASLPLQTIGVPYNYSFDLVGDTPMFVNTLVKPGWMAIDMVGRTITFSGTPPDATQPNVSVRFSNCSGLNTVDFAGNIVGGGGGSTPLHAVIHTISETTCNGRYRVTVYANVGDSLTIREPVLISGDFDSIDPSPTVTETYSAPIDLFEFLRVVGHTDAKIRIDITNNTSSESISVFVTKAHISGAFNCPA